MAFCGNTGHRYPHFPWPQEDQAWLQIAAQIIHINMGPSDSVAHRYQYGFCRQLRPWTYTWTSVETPTMDIHIAADHRHAPQQQHGPQTSTWLQVATQTMDIPMAFGGNMGHGHWHGPRWSHGFLTWPVAFPLFYKHFKFNFS